MGVATLHADLRAAVRTRLGATAGLPAAQAWEGRPYQPVLGTAFLSEQLRPIASEHRAVGPGGTTMHTSTANLALRYPNGKGTLPIETAAGALLAAFKPGTRLAYGATVGVVQRAERLPLEQETDWLSGAVVVTILAWTAD